MEDSGACQPFLWKWTTLLSESLWEMLGQDPGMNLAAEALRSLGLLWSGWNWSFNRLQRWSGLQRESQEESLQQLDRGSCVLTLTMACAGEK